MVKGQGGSGQIKLMFIILMARAALSEDNELSVAALSEDNEYCNLKTCPNRSHTLCKYEEFGSRFGPGCANMEPYGIPIEKYRTLFLSYHQSFRIPKVMQNEELPDLPSLMPILVLEWDEELEIAAQVWANQCPSVPDTCRNVARFNVTQRVSIQESLGGVSMIAYSTAIREWFEEERERILNFASSSSGESSISASKQFARSPWSNANRIGCGYTRFRRPFSLYVISYFVCNYGYENPNQVESYLIDQQHTYLINQDPTYLITQK